MNIGRFFLSIFHLMWKEDWLAVVIIIVQSSLIEWERQTKRIKMEYKTKNSKQSAFFFHCIVYFPFPWNHFAKKQFHSIEVNPNVRKWQQKFLIRWRFYHSESQQCMKKSVGRKNCHENGNFGTESVIICECGECCYCIFVAFSHFIGHFVISYGKCERENHRVRSVL